MLLLKKSFSVIILFLGAAGFSVKSQAQEVHIAPSQVDSQYISLRRAVLQGLDSSKKLRLSETQIMDAIAKYEEVMDSRLPQIKASYTASKAFIPTKKIQIEGMMKDPVYLPGTSMLYIGNVSVNETIFAGNKMKYAERSAGLLEQIARLNNDNDREDVALLIIESYVNLFKIDESLKIVSQNLRDVQGRLDETIQYREQGLATDNDVLRFKLEKSKVQLAQIDLQHNREVANYAMTVLLGLPVMTILKVDSVSLGEVHISSPDQLVRDAFVNRQDLATFEYQKNLADINIKNIKSDKLPVLGAGFSTYYLNPNSRFFPPEYGYLVPVTLGLNLSWNISGLYTNKHKLNEAEVKRDQVRIERSALSDKISVDVNKGYHTYQNALEKIKVLETAVEQAGENDRIMELKYQNQLATTTDRIDAQTLLYQSLLNLNLARADAATDYYQLLNVTGTLNKMFNK